MESSKPSLTILGGGPAGLGLAFYAHRAGVRFTLLERTDEVGGLCRTIRHGPHAYDMGAHRLHDQDAQVTADLRALLGDDLEPVDAPSAIFDEGRFVAFPPTPQSLLCSVGLREIAGIGLEILRARASRAPLRSFEDFAIRSFGPTLARRYLTSYSEKLWGHPAHQLAPDVSTKRLSGMSALTLVRELLFPESPTDHIDGTFLYPRGGYGRICEALAASLPPESIRTGACISRLICKDQRITEIELAGGERIEARGRVLSTLPLTILIRMLGDAVPRRLADQSREVRFRSVRLLFLRLRKPRVSDNATIYHPDPHVCVTRFHEPRNRSRTMTPRGETSLVAEVPCFSDDALFTIPDSELALRTIREISATGLIEPHDVIEWRHHLLPSAYPVYSLGYAEVVHDLIEGIRPIRNLTPFGRSGQFWYSHLHDQLAHARAYIASGA